jgi:hypothetical protein
MSLIVDINPVPWKILDLVRARILKNRAKKAKKGMDWSQETIKREMSLQPGPLSKRKRDEPSFVAGGETYIIQGTKETAESGTQIFTWKAWLNQVINTGEFRIYNRLFGSIFPLTSDTTITSNHRNFKTKLYVSFFDGLLTAEQRATEIGTVDGRPIFRDVDVSPVITLITTGTADGNLRGDSNYPGIVWNSGVAEMFNLFGPGPMADMLSDDTINPLYAWQAKASLPSGLIAYANRLSAYEVSQVECPVVPEFDESRISKVPGYIKTVLLEFQGLPTESLETVVDF